MLRCGRTLFMFSRTAMRLKLTSDTPVPYSENAPASTSAAAATAVVAAAAATSASGPSQPLTKTSKAPTTKSPSQVPDATSELLKLRQHSLRNLNQHFEQLGVGGLNQKLERVLKDVLRSRCLSEKDRTAFGLRHHKGVLFHGPPGTGKTLIARCLAEVLRIKSENVTVVNANEISSEYFGQSEKNVKKLFEAAVADWKEHGEASELHCLIFDEIDAIGTRRGLSANVRFHDNVLNMLLACLDGVDQINNLIVFGLTNRLDVLDPALTRHGRLGVHVEIPLPDFPARSAILRVHSAALRQSGRTTLSDADLKTLALKTPGLSGADLAAVVQTAVSLTLDAHDICGEAPAEVLVSMDKFTAAVEVIKSSSASK